MSFGRIKPKVLGMVVPSSDETKTISSLVKKVKSRINVPGAKVFVGGSFGKGTWLKNLTDVDIYVRFDKKKYSNCNISNVLFKYLKKNFEDVEVVHGSRDYFHINILGLVFEIIPILGIKKVRDAENIMDISPFHVLWVKKHPKLANEIRLTKQFCRANGIYGAESFIRGFSGYAVEILTIHYGSFIKLAKAASRWTGKTVIDTEKLLKDPLRELNISKIRSPLILVDPVQDTRNAAATVSEKKYNLFIKKCNEFLERFDEGFFEESPFDIEDVREKAKGHKLLILEVVPFTGKVDVVGAKILKVYEHLTKQVAFNNFNLIDSGWEWDKSSNALIWLIAKKEILARKKQHFGPPLKSIRRLESFKKKHYGLKVKRKKGHSYVMKLVEHRKVEDFVSNLIETEPYVLEKVKRISLV